MSQRCLSDSQLSKEDSGSPTLWCSVNRDRVPAEWISGRACHVRLSQRVTAKRGGGRLRRRQRFCPEHHNLSQAMKSVQPLLALVFLATTAVSIPTALRVDNVPEYSLSLESADDFDWNLQDMRLVQLAPDVEPVWMTELEKVIPALMLYKTSLMKVDSSQGCGTELYGYVRIYASPMTHSVTAYNILAPRPRISTPSLP